MANKRKIDLEQSNCIIQMKSDIKTIKEKIEKMPTKDEMNLTISETIEKVLEKCDKKFATIERIKPVEKIVYGMAGAVLFTVLIAILASIIPSQ